MASIRRTLTPSHHTLPTQQPPIHRPNHSLFARPRKAAHHHHQNQKPPWHWKAFLLRCLSCFLLGSLLALSPFSALRLQHQEQDDDPPLLPLPSSHNAATDRSKPRRSGQEIEVPPSTTSGGGTDYAREPPGTLLLVVTPTYNRALQAYYLTRLAHTLRLVPPPLLWIVVEMGPASMETADLLRTAGVMYRHLVCDRNSSDVKDRGVHQRNAALRHIEAHHLDGILYFADDDNIYSLDLFDHMRGIRRFGTWPVAMLAQGKNKATLEGPVCNGTQVSGWQTNEKSKRLRRFHVDMSGFAFNSTILWDPKRWHRPTSDKIRQLDTVKEGFQETTFIEQLVEDESRMEGIPHGCSRIMNWHLHLEAKDLVYPRGWSISRNLDVVIPLQ